MPVAGSSLQSRGTIPAGVGRRFLQLIAALAVFVLPLATAMTPARADNTSDLLALVNSLRVSHGSPPMVLDPTLTQIASTWSAHMASGAGLVHNPSLVAEIPTGWAKIGENIGDGSNLNAVFNALVNSPVHYANMVDPTFNLTGIGVVAGSGGTLWITEDFESRSSGATSPPPATTPPTSPPTTAAPKPVVHATATVPKVSTTAAPSTAPPTTAAPTTTTPPTTAPATTTSTTLAIATVPSYPLAASPGPSKIVASVSAHGSDGGWIVLAVSILAVVAVAASAFVFKARWS